MNDPYKILGVSPSDDEKTIKKKYNALVKKYHPDVNKDAGSKEKFNEIHAAYETIKNNIHNNNNSFNSNIDIDSIFKQYGNINININQTIRTHINITFKELQNGCEKIIQADNTLLSFTVPPNTTPSKIFTLTTKNKTIRVSLKPYQDGFDFFNNKLTKIVKLTSKEFNELNTIEVVNHVDNHYKVSLKSGMASNQILRIPNAGLNNQPLYVQLVVIKE